MFKGLRWPFAALVLASVLLVAAVIARTGDRTNEPSPQATATASPSPVPTPSPATPVPTLPPETPLPQALESMPPENVLVEALVGRIVKLNPLLATYNPVDRDITALIFEGLTTTDAYGDIVPDLAVSWSVSPDGLQYIVVLRDDVLWQDGLPFTARDVVFTMRLMGDPLFPGAATLREFWRTVEVDALSDTMVRFRLTQPLASFPDQLRVGIVPAHVLEGTPVQDLEQHPFNLSPIGTGPYQMEALTASQGQIDGIQLRVAPVYRQRPEGATGYLLDRIVFRTYDTPEAALEAFRQGEVNSIGSIAPELESAAQQMPGLSLYTTIAPRVGVLIYNWERPAIRYVRNPRVRLALAHAIDRAGVVTRHLAGYAIPADSPLLPTSWAYAANSPWPDYDPARAAAIMDTVNLVFEEPAEEPEATASPEGEPTPENEAEAPPDAPTEEMTETATEEPTPEPEEPLSLALTLLTRDDPALADVANAIASAWNPLGFEVSVETVPASALRQRLEAGDFDAAIVEFSFEPSADPDPFVFWHQGQYGSGQNYGGMDDRRISEALEAARRDPTGVNRATHYRRFQELFAERVPALVLYYPLYIYAADSHLQGIQLGFMGSASDRFRSIQDWYFEP